jgi:hypothetical protein
LLSSGEYSIDKNTVTFLSRVLKSGDVVSSVIIKNSSGTALTVDTEEYIVDGASDTITFTNPPKMIFLNGVLLGSSEYTVDNSTNIVTFLSKVLNSGDVVTATTNNTSSSSNVTGGTKKYEHTYSAVDNNVIAVPADMDLTTIIVYNNGVVLRSLTYTANNTTKEITFVPGTLSDDDWVLVQVV